MCICLYVCLCVYACVCVCGLRLWVRLCTCGWCVCMCVRERVTNSANCSLCRMSILCVLVLQTERDRRCVWDCVCIFVCVYLCGYICVCVCVFVLCVLKNETMCDATNKVTIYERWRAGVETHFQES